MRKLRQIINMVRDGERPDYEELRYAICALEALSTLDIQALSKLAQAEMDGQKPILTRSAVHQYEEHFNRNKRALDTDPKNYVGWNNDPDNPEFLSRRKMAMRLVKAI